MRIKIFDACQRIAGYSGSGHRREDLTAKPLLFWPVGVYLLVYTTAHRSLEVVRVLHGALDIPKISYCPSTGNDKGRVLARPN